MSKRLPKATLHTLDEIRRESRGADTKTTPSEVAPEAFSPPSPPAGRRQATKAQTAKTAGTTQRPSAGTRSASAAASSPTAVPKDLPASASARKDTPARLPALAAEAASIPVLEAKAKKDTPESGSASTPKTAPESATSEAKTTVPQPAPAPANKAPSPRELHRMGAALIVERHTTYAALGGCVPLLVVDSLSVGLIIYNMLRSLAAHYRFRWQEEQLKATLAALLGGILAPGTGSLTTHLLNGFVPGAWLFGSAASSLTAAVCTRYIGETFIAHFEAGGTLNDIDVAGIRASLKARIEAA